MRYKFWEIPLFPWNLTSDCSSTTALWSLWIFQNSFMAGAYDIKKYGVLWKMSNPSVDLVFKCNHLLLKPLQKTQKAKQKRQKKKWHGFIIVINDTYFITSTRRGWSKEPSFGYSTGKIYQPYMSKCTQTEQKMKAITVEWKLFSCTVLRNSLKAKKN